MAGTSLLLWKDQPCLQADSEGSGINYLIPLLPAPVLVSGNGEGNTTMKFAYYYGQTPIGFYQTDAYGNASIYVNQPGFDTNIALNIGACIGAANYKVARADITLGNGNHNIVSKAAVSKINLGADWTATSMGNNTIATYGTSDSVNINSGGTNTINYYGSGHSQLEINSPYYGSGLLTRNVINDHYGNYDTIQSWNDGGGAITANGSGESISVGHGNYAVTALGSGDTICIWADAKSVDNIKMGFGSALTISGGKDQITLNGIGDAVTADALIAGSTINALGNNEIMFIGSNSSAVIHLDLNAVGDAITIQAGSDGNYTGNLRITGFGDGDHINLNGFGFSSGLQCYNPLTTTINLPGGGHIAFDATSYIAASEFSVKN
jgi:hypothetical protein